MATPIGSGPLHQPFSGVQMTREGEVWSIACGDSELRLRDSKGLRYLAALLSHPDVELHALDLAGVDEQGRVTGADVATTDPGGLGDSGPALDEAAKADYRRRIGELREEVEEAEAFNDPERAARAREELEFVERELTAAVGLGGRDRKQGSATERARVNVTRSLRSALAKIAEHDPPLGERLGREITTGTFCVYRPSGVGPAPAAEAVPPATGRALRTLLFTDIVGSTEHVARLGDSVWRDLLQAHDSVVDEKVREHGGRVAGQTGDGFLLEFDSPVAAVACAQSIAGALKALGLDVRAGLHTGDCERLGGTLTGMAVHVASRVCELAEAGEVLTTDTVRDLLAGSDFALVDRGAHRLKGVPGQRSVFALHTPDELAPAVQARAARGRLAQPPLPARLSAAAAGGLLGRTTELQRAHGLIERVRAGERRALLLAGEPGIGKTRLAAEIAVTAHAGGVTVLHGRCDRDLAIPYQPFAEVVTELSEAAPGALLERHRDDYGDILGRLAPRLGTQGGALAEGDQHLLFSAVAGLLAAAAAERPLAIVIDDLHAADKPTLLLVKYLLTSSSAHTMLLIGTYRSTELVAGHPLAAAMADLRREPGVEHLALHGLDEPDVAALADAVAGRSGGSDRSGLARALWEETEGNPFFVAEMVRHLIESGEVSQSEPPPDRGRGAINLPRGVRETINERVGRLGGSAPGILTSAAVIGDEFDLELLRVVTGEDEDPLLDTLDAAVAASLLTEAPQGRGRYAFAHGLISQTLYESLGPGGRGREHWRVALALERLVKGDPGARIGELAHHAVEGARGEDMRKAVDYARGAGDRALSQLAPDEAERWYAQALELEEGLARNGPLRCDLMIDLGTAQCRAGNPDFRQTLLEAADLARGLQDGDRLARAAVANTRGFVSATGLVDEDRVAVLEAALEAPEVDDSTRARLLATLAAELTFAGDFPRRRRLSDEALAAARSLGHQDTLANVLSTRFMAIWTPETLAERRENTAEELALAERAGDPLARFRALHWRAVTCIESGDLDEAWPLIERENRLAERLGEPTATWLATYDRAIQALIRGLLDEAEHLAEEAGQIATDSGQPEALAFYAGQLANVRFEQGRLGDLAPLLADSLELNPGIPAFGGALALARLEDGDDEGARELLRSAAAGEFGALPYDSNWLVGLALYAEVCVRLGERGPAGALRAKLGPFEDQIAFNSATAWGSVARHLGGLEAVLGDYGPARDRLERAASLHERIGAPIWLARTRLDLARVELAAGGDAARAQSLLAEALATAQDLGAEGVARRARELMEET